MSYRVTAFLAVMVPIAISGMAKPGPAWWPERTGHARDGYGQWQYLLDFPALRSSHPKVNQSTPENDHVWALSMPCA
ncbi:hypothetical protein HD554DRAFT_1595521 [Boletus coccyginus]|nr:hypothetical protein HD554DRAFT_1595521 [Boletus coccyginus]